MNIISYCKDSISWAYKMVRNYPIETKLAFNLAGILSSFALIILENGKKMSSCNGTMGDSIACICDLSLLENVLVLSSQFIDSYAHMKFKDNSRYHASRVYTVVKNVLSGGHIIHILDCVVRERLPLRVGEKIVIASLQIYNIYYDIALVFKEGYKKGIAERNVLMNSKTRKKEKNSIKLVFDKVLN